MRRLCLTLSLLMILAVCFAGTTGTIKGTVMDAKGRGLTDATVQVLQVSNVTSGTNKPDKLINGTGILATVQTKVGGTFRITNITHGNYVLRFSCDGYLPNHEMKIIVKVNQTTIANVNLNVDVSYNSKTTSKPNTGKITGKIKDTSGKSLAYANVVVKIGGKSITGTQTTENGLYTIINIPPGTYSVEFSLIGYSKVRNDSIRVKVGVNTTVNATLTKTSIQMKPVIIPEKQKKIDDGQTDSNSSLNMSQMDAYRNNNDIAEMQAGNQNTSPKMMSKSFDGMAVSDPASAKHIYNETIRPMPDDHKYPKPKEDWWGCHYIHNYIPLPPPQRLPYNTEDYAKVIENEYQYAIAQPLSTFSIDVDTAGYTNIRRLINGGTLPEKGYIRIEELLNYFDYDYPQPTDNKPFAVYTELGEAPWNTRHKLLHIGLQGKDVDMREALPSNLVFLLDVSGSMGDANKLSLVKEAMQLLIKQLRPEDYVSIVTYSTTPSVLLHPLSGRHKTELLEAVNNLYAGGSTAGGAGIKMAYDVAAEQFQREGNNRIILCTDGDFNNGEYSNDAMEKLVTAERDKGVFLTILGFGVGNIKDSKMELMADKGNGNYAYIDNLVEAHKVLVKEMGGSLITIAKDVKLQLEFNPAKVKAYRLVGYENRSLNNEDFNNDKIDAGELGAGHTVTALYELIPAGSDESVDGIDPLKYQAVNLTDEAKTGNELLTIKLRYKQPESKESTMMTKVVLNNPVSAAKNSENYRFSAAVAGFGLLLKDSRYKGNTDWNMVLDLANSSIGKDPDGYRREFITLSEQARDLMHRHYYYDDDKQYRE